MSVERLCGKCMRILTTIDEQPATAKNNLKERSV